MKKTRLSRFSKGLINILVLLSLLLSYPGTVAQAKEVETPPNNESSTADDLVEPKPLNSDLQAEVPFEFALPWEFGKYWKLTGGIWPKTLWENDPRPLNSHHRYNYGGALDFVPVVSDGQKYDDYFVTAAGWGFVTNVYKENNVICGLEITHGGESGFVTIYRHLAGVKVNLEDEVFVGTKLGRLAKASEPKCGIWTGIHLHFELKPKNSSWIIKDNIFQWNGTLSGYRVFYYDGYNPNVGKEYVTLIQREDATYKQCAGPNIDCSGGSIKNDYCPSPRGQQIIFYRYPNYSCGGKPEGEGFLKFYPNQISPDYQLSGAWIWQGSLYIPDKITVPSDLALSIQENGGNQKALIEDSTINLYKDVIEAFNRTWPSYLVNVKENINYCAAQSSIRVDNQIDSTCIPNNPPNTPTLISPANGFVSTNFIAPTLCWKDQGDPEGHRREFYAEVIGSANSGWTNNTCWRPSQLDYKYTNFEWRVKSRDSLGAESAWSSTWGFSILPPNYPPAINFNTANGDNFASGVIYSRSQQFTFQGTASDPEGQLNRIEFACGTVSDDCGVQSAHSGTNSWSHSRSDMAGRNDIYFSAFDAYGNKTSSRHLDLRIDLVAPDTTLGLNTDSNPQNWPSWFKSPVYVSLYAQDMGTGNALSGVKQLFYRMDGGAWNTFTGFSINFYVENDGSHTVDYYAEDFVGNIEAIKSVSFQIDQTPPTDPSEISELNLISSDSWQNQNNTPKFSWNDGYDELSGLWGYQLYFGSDPSGTGFTSFSHSDAYQWIPQPGGVATGTYYLRGRTRDIAGNWTPWSTWFIYRYDGTPPENPTNVAHIVNITSTVWQNSTNVAQFSWPLANDEGSGIQGYYVAWGLDPDETTTNFVGPNEYINLEPLCAIDSACIGYLRLRSVDNVGNLANEWGTLFELRYDNASPMLDFGFNDGSTETFQTTIKINISASDLGSGLRSMRLSGDGVNWTEFEAYTDVRYWTIPAIGRQSWPVYIQVQDWVGLNSKVEMREIILETNIRQPKSQSYWLMDNDLNSGSEKTNSSLYSSHSSLGQNYDSTTSSSESYLLISGYESASQAIPIIQPEHDDYSFINGIFASGKNMIEAVSASYQMHGVFGEFGLSNSTEISSSNFVHQPGFLAADPSKVTQGLDIPPGDEPEPDPVITCETPSVLINDNALFTNELDVTLNICAPQVSEMMISNSPDFVGSDWEPYAEIKHWALPSTANTSSPVHVYAKFKSTSNIIIDTYFDEIVFDPNRPIGEILGTDDISQSIDSPNSTLRYLVEDPSYTLDRLTPTLPVQPDGSVVFHINSFDDFSGVAEIQLSDTPEFLNSEWQAFSSAIPWIPPEGDGPKTVFARIKDHAGNIALNNSFEFIYDTFAPYGSISIENSVINSETKVINLYLFAIDGIYDDSYEIIEEIGYEGVVTEMRIGYDPTFTDIPWQPYSFLYTIPISPDPSQTTIYVQYRDQAGNATIILSDTYTIDNEAPLLTAVVENTSSMQRSIYLSAFDNESGIYDMRLSADPLMIDDLYEMSYTDIVEWDFSNNKSVWIQVSDVAGNWSEPYPVYAYDITYVEPDNCKIYLPLILQ